MTQASLILLNVPFALVGGVAALWLQGLNLNLSASVGLIALFGVAVLNGIALVSHINSLPMYGDHLVSQATQENPCTRRIVYRLLCNKVVGGEPEVEQIARCHATVLNL